MCGERERRNIGGLARRLWRARGGVAAVEFGLMAPFVLLIFAGIVEFGFALQDHHVMAKGVRDGARYLSRMADPTAAASVDNAKNLAMTGSLDGGAPLLLPYWDDKLNETFTSVTFVDNSAGTFRGGPNILLVSVEARVPYEGGLFTGWFFSGGATFTVRHEERHIGE